MIGWIRCAMTTCAALALVACETTGGVVGSKECGAGFVDDASAASGKSLKKFENNFRCAGPELVGAADAFAAKAPSGELRLAFRRLFLEGERNAVLNYQRVAMVAMAQGQWSLAERALDRALGRIEAIYANNEQAEKARSVFSAEEVKDFKGEPYERSMAYYYRGLLYASKGDYQNARAMFLQADYQDTLSDSERFAGDFGIMPMLAAWASACDGNDNLAKDYMQRGIQADASLSEFDAGKPLLLIYESGRAPYKFNTGKYGEALKWMPHAQPDGVPTDAVCVEPAPEKTGVQAGSDAALSQKKGAAKPRPLAKGPDAPAAVAAAPLCVPRLFKAGDVGFQAMTRGGRAVDTVLKGKASFKEGAQTVADVSQTVATVALMSSLQNNNRDMANLGLAGLFIGLAAQVAEQNAQAKADIREWEQLPKALWVGQLAGKTQDTTLRMGGQSLQRLGDDLNAQCKVFWGREVSPAKNFYEAGPVAPSLDKRDEAFRAELIELLS